MSKEERDKLVVDNMRLVYYLVHKHYPTHICNEDLKQEGMVGLIQAADTWDEPTTKFSTYAGVCILNQLRYYFRREGKQPKAYSLDMTFTNSEGDEYSLQDTMVGEEDVDLTDFCYERFLEDLDERDKRILELSPTHTEMQIAEIVGISQAHVSRRKKVLRKKWRKFNGDD